MLRQQIKNSQTHYLLHSNASMRSCKEIGTKGVASLKGITTCYSVYLHFYINYSVSD